MPAKTKRRKGVQPGRFDALGNEATKVLAQSALEAEAVDAKLAFAFRGEMFELDLKTMDLGRAQFALAMADRGVNLVAQYGRLVDAFEAVLGTDQLERLYAAAPDLMSSEDAQREFWTAFSLAVSGGTPGESSAS